MAETTRSNGARRDQFVTPSARRGGIPLGPVIGIMAVLVAAIVYFVGFRDSPSPVATAAPLAHSTAETPPLQRSGAAAPVDRPDVVLPAAQFDDGKARFFTYQAAGDRTVRFFVMKSGDGVIRAAFDACDVCYRERLGYRQQGDHLLCINCGQTFRSTDINVRQGGCNPAPLDRALVGDQVRLEAADLERGAFYF